MSLEPALPEPVIEQRSIELEEIRASGFAVSQGEVDEGVWACAAAVWRRGHLVGALSVVAPAYRTDEAKQGFIAEVVRSAAAELGTAAAKAG